SGCAAPHEPPLQARWANSACKSAHMRKSSCLPLLSAGWQARSEGGAAKISHPPPASTEEKPSTSLKKARSASALRVYTTACMPVIMTISIAGNVRSLVGEFRALDTIEAGHVRSSHSSGIQKLAV